jgi:heterodisulfide reductase subunit C
MERFDVEYIKEMSRTDVRKCMKCGKCSGRCPAYSEMDYKPHQFVTMLGQGRVEELLKSKSIYTCLSCMACVERCPRGVAPANVIEAIRDIVERQQNGDAVKPEDIPALIEDGVPQQLLVSLFRKYKK